MKDLILTSLQAHKEYAVNHIHSSKGKLYYTEMMDLIQTCIQTCTNYQLLLIVLESAFSKLRPVALSFNRELKYKKLALQHASEAIIAINQRFNK